jgi:ABC-type lipoprotein release transport system permease subunit
MRLLHSLRLSARTLLRQPALALTAIVTLALGIGLSTWGCAWHSAPRRVTSSSSFLAIDRALAIAGIGVSAELAAAVLANGLLSSLPYDVGATDVATLGAAALFLTTVAVLASLAPSRASARIDPVVALRAEG